MVRILLACAFVVSLASVAEADQTSTLTVDITNRGCVIDVAPRSVRGPVLVDANLALWVSPIDAVGPIRKIDVEPPYKSGLVRSVNLCAAIQAGVYGITAVFEPGISPDYHASSALRGTAVITIPEATIAEPQELIICSRDASAPEATSSNRRAWLIGASGALLAMLALFAFARRRGVDTYIV